MRAAWYEKQGPAREVLEIFRRYGAVAICMDPRSRISQASGVRNYAPAASRAQRRSSPASSRHPTGPKKNSTGPSSHDLVSDATVHSRADVLFGVKVIWGTGIALARLVECLYLFRRERQVEARKIILQLRKLSCPDDGDDRHRAVAEPCQRDFRHAAAGLIRYRFDGRDDSAGSLLLGHEILIRHHRVAVQAALLGRAVAVVLAGQNAFGEW